MSQNQSGRLNRRKFIRRAAAGTAGALLASSPKLFAATPTSRPNVIFILTDDLAWGDLSLYGRSDYSTPNLDQLAREGTRLTNAYANQAVCTPTRVAFYTGRYAARLPIGLREPLGYVTQVGTSVGLPPEHPTIASLLKGNGYDTALIGKWHAGYFPTYGPLQSGFNEYFGNRGPAVDYFRHTDANNVPDLWDNDTPVTRSGYLTDLYTDRAISFIQRSRTKPFFLTLTYTSPHWPWQGPNDEATTANLQGNQWLNTGSTAVYGEIVKNLDANVGRLLQALKASGLEENTLVIFTSDNGGQNSYSNFGALRGLKGQLFEGGIRVPAFLRWPGVIPANQVSRQTAVTFDWTATILAATQTAADPNYPLDGQNLLPVVKEKNLLTIALCFGGSGERIMRCEVVTGSM